MLILEISVELGRMLLVEEVKTRLVLWDWTVVVWWRNKLDEFELIAQR